MRRINCHPGAVSFEPLSGHTYVTRGIGRDLQPGYEVLGVVLGGRVAKIGKESVEVKNTFRGVRRILKGAKK